VKILKEADVPFILISPYTNGKVVQDQRRAYIPSKGQNGLGSWLLC